jgi:uncharacterized protein YfaS (alpha-2-macroglobulin family)
MTISGSGGGETQTVGIKIFDSNDVEIHNSDTIISTNIGSFQMLWIIPSDIVPGTYKIQAKIGNEVAETTFSVQ